MSLDKNQIAQRIAQELQQNMYVNLGIGIPTLVANYIPKDIDIEFQSETVYWAWARFHMRVRKIQI